MTWILSGFADEASESIDEQIETLAASKIDHIDLRCVDGINIVDLPLDHAEAVQKKLQAAGVSVCMYGSPIGKLNLADDLELDLKRLRHLGKLQSIFGARKVRIFSYYNREGADEAAWRKGSLDQLRKLVDLADELGLVLYHENELNIFGDYLRRVCVLRDELHKPHPDAFRLIFDFDNFNQCEENVWDNYLELRDHVGAIHLKESRRQADGSYQHVPVGEGDGHIPQILGDLAERGWEGPLTLEPHLARSAAVLATGPHGAANQSLSDLSPQECFVVAAQAAHKVIEQVGRQPA